MPKTAAPQKKDRKSKSRSKKTGLPLHVRIGHSFSSKSRNARESMAKWYGAVLGKLRLDHSAARIRSKFSDFLRQFMLAFWSFLSALKLDRLGNAIKRPFQPILTRIHRAFDWILVRTIFSKRSKKLLDANRRLGEIWSDGWNDALTKMKQWSERSPAMRVFLWPLRAVLIGSRGSLEFFFYWITTRNYMQLIASIPALLMTTPLVLALVMIPLHSNEAKLRRYLMAAQRAAENDDPDAAQLFYRRVAILHGASNHANLGLAALAEESGDYEKALELMLELSPHDEAGLIQGHLWIANAMAADLVETEGKDKEKLIKEHINHALSVDPRNPDGLGLLSDHYLRTGQSDEAIDTIERIPIRNPQEDLANRVRMALAKTQAGQLADAQSLLEESSQSYARIYEQDESDLDTVSYLRWAASHELQGDLRRAIGVLDVAMQKYPDDRILQDVYRRSQLKLLARLSDNWKKLEIARTLYQRFPDSSEVQHAVAALVESKIVNNEAYTMLRPKIDSGTIPIDVLERVAMSSVNRGDMKKGRELFNLVIRRDPDRPDSLNNLAWIISHYEPFELKRAETLIDRAIGFQDKAEFQGTLGQVLFKLGKWEEAIVALERAINGIPDNPMHFEALAESNSKLGNQELANHYQQRFDAMQTADN